jgi:hypothetical protein
MDVVVKHLAVAGELLYEAVALSAEALDAP